MKILGFIFGLVVALLIWAATIYLAGMVVHLVPEYYRIAALIGAVALLAGGGWGGRRVWKATIAKFEHWGRLWEQRQVAKWAEIARQVRADSQQHADQRWMASNLERRLEGSHAVARSLPALVQSAESWLDEAEKEFTSGMLVPFWDAMESAVTSLATYTSHLDLLCENARHYRKDASRLETAPPPFSLGLDAVPEAQASAERMKTIVLWSHGNNDFSVLYEMRKDRAIPVAGFKSLDEAVNTLAMRIAKSREALVSSLAGGGPPQPRKVSLKGR